MKNSRAFTVGLVKSVKYDIDKRQFRGIIETSNSPELPFVVSSDLENIQKGKMVKFIKETDSLIPRAINIEKL